MAGIVGIGMGGMFMQEYAATCPRCELMKFASIPLLDYRFKLRASQSKSVILTRRPKK
ncbi:hypothetical protein ABBZ33_02000 [Acinetobacter baumannii]